MNRTVLSGLTALALAIAVTVGLDPQPVAAAVCNNSPTTATQLCSGTVTPGSGTPATTFHFSVVYQDSNAAQPGHLSFTVKVTVRQGPTIVGYVDMTPGAPINVPNIVNGIPMPARTFPITCLHAHRVRRCPQWFRPAAGRPIAGHRRRPDTDPAHADAETHAEAHPEAHAETHARHPRPTPRPTPKPTPKPTPHATQAPAGATAAPTGTPAPTAVATGEPSPSDEASDSLPPVAIGGGGTATSTPDLTGAGPLAPIGGSNGPSPIMGLVLGLVAFIVGGAFAILAARRRRRKDDDRPLATAAAISGGSGPAGAALAMGKQSAPLDELIEEGSIPRWRRPSLRAARSAADRGVAGPTYQLAFDAAAAAGSERRLVRYRVVRMMDGPDEIRSQEVGQLEENDELEVLGRYAGYVHVRTPVGTEGWVHRTTLGPPIGSETPDADAGPPEFDLEAAFNLQRKRTAAIGRPAAGPLAMTVPAVADAPRKGKRTAAPVATPVPVPVAAPAEATEKSKRKTPTRRSRKAEPST